MRWIQKVDLGMILGYAVAQYITLAFVPLVWVKRVDEVEQHRCIAGYSMVLSRILKA